MNGLIGVRIIPGASLTRLIVWCGRLLSWGGVEQISALQAKVAASEEIVAKLDRELRAVHADGEKLSAELSVAQKKLSEYSAVRGLIDAGGCRCCWRDGWMRVE